MICFIAENFLLFRLKIQGDPSRGGRTLKWGRELVPWPEEQEKGIDILLSCCYVLYTLHILS